VAIYALGAGMRACDSGARTARAAAEKHRPVNGADGFYAAQARRCAWASTIGVVRQPINLDGHDKVVLAVALYLLGSQRNRRVPSRSWCRPIRDVLHEYQRFTEVSESEGPLNAMGIVRERPVRSLSYRIGYG
jgi:hypothetical protein